MTRAEAMAFQDDFAVTLEISAAQYFPWLIAEAQQAIANRELMPGRFIRVRKMKESEADCGDMLALAAAMQIMGASYVETLDTKGTDGSNIHLGGPDTITGYFGGIGQPNDHALKWVDEFLYYYTTYGIQQVLNINPGTVLVGYLLYKLGIDNEFKISRLHGQRQPLRRAVDADRRQAVRARRRHLPADRLQLEQLGQQRDHRDHGRGPHARWASRTWCASSITSPRRTGASCASRTTGATSWWSWPITWPTSRPSTKAATRTSSRPATHPSDILDYFRDKGEIEAAGDMPQLLRNYLDKHDAVNRTARALTEHGLSFVAARKLHHRG